MAELYRTIENPLVVVLARMEHVGIAVDVDELRALERPLDGRGRRASVRELRTVAGRDDFNLNSPKQLREILFDRARPESGQEDQDRLLDRRRDAGEDRATSGPSSSIRCCGTARSRSCAAPTARACSPRSPPTGGSTPRSTRPWPAPAGCQSDQPNLHNIPVRTRGGASVPQGVRAGAGHAAARRRLQPDRAALHRPPGRPIPG